MSSLPSVSQTQSTLDFHITTYLDLLTTYQTLQADLSHHISEGFINLARANYVSSRNPSFSSPSSSLFGSYGYGRDYFEFRKVMRAMRGVEIEIGESRGDDDMNVSKEGDGDLTRFRTKLFEVKDEGEEGTVQEKVEDMELEDEGKKGSSVPLPAPNKEIISSMSSALEGKKPSTTVKKRAQKQSKIRNNEDGEERWDIGADQKQPEQQEQSWILVKSEKQEVAEHSSQTGENPSQSQTAIDHSATRRDPRDPIKWFGILVPNELKEAQTCFKAAMDQVPELITLRGNIEWHESQIRRLKKKKEAEKEKQNSKKGKEDKRNEIDTQDLGKTIELEEKDG